MEPDEVRSLDNDKAILFIRGEKPIIDKKYDLSKHPNVKYTTEGGAEPYRYGESKNYKNIIRIELGSKDSYSINDEEMEKYKGFDMITEKEAYNIYS